MREAKNTKRLLDELKRLAESGEIDGINAALDIDGLSGEERKIAGLFNRVLSNYNTSVRQELNKYRLTAGALDFAHWDMEVANNDPADPCNRFIWSSEFRRMLGFDGENDLPDTFAGLSDCLPPCDKGRVREALAAHLSDRTGKTQYNIEYRMRTKGGEYRRIHMFGVAMRDPDGKPLHVAGTLKDITDMMRQQEVLEKILDTMDSYVYVTDPETDEILYINQLMKTNFKPGEDFKDGKCWERLNTGMEKRCALCKKPLLHENPDMPITWEETDLATRKTFYKIDRIIDWPGGRKAHMQQRIDITAAESTRETLERREKMLDAINKAAVMLLTRREEFFPDTMTDGIGLIAGIANLDRMSVFRNTEKPEGLFLSQLYRWKKETGSIVEVLPELLDTAYSSLVSGWAERLEAGECISGPIRLMPEAAALKRFGCVTVLIVPVFDDGKFWGFTFFERLEEEVFTEYETEVLRSASLMLANAVIRDAEAAKIRKATERANIMLNATPLGCVLLDSNLNFIDYNEAAMKLFGFAEKADFLERFLDCSPEYQPDGRRSDEKAHMLVKKAFDEGRGVFEWAHQTLGGTPIPTEVTLVRVEYGDGPIVAGYMRDLRAVRKMERNILKLESEVEKIYYDQLTGICNRRFFDKSIDRLIKSLSRAGGTLCLMMIDIDYFKQYNDMYGHIAGDNCLKIVAKTLRGAVKRDDDFVARYGGEEFVIVFPHVDEAGARLLADRLLEDVRRCGISHEKSDVADCVTISIGVIVGKVKHTHSRNDFIQGADDMLYKAKHSGRDRYAVTIL